eukprot:2819613-Rhodomonas_salina.1
MAISSFCTRTLTVLLFSSLVLRLVPGRARAAQRSPSAPSRSSAAIHTPSQYRIHTLPQYRFPLLPYATGISVPHISSRPYASSVPHVEYSHTLSQYRISAPSSSRPYASSVPHVEYSHALARYRTSRLALQPYANLSSAAHHTCSTTGHAVAVPHITQRKGYYSRGSDLQYR